MHLRLVLGLLLIGRSLQTLPCPILLPVAIFLLPKIGGLLLLLFVTGVL
jgi:hypothetical protein